MEEIRTSNGPEIQLLLPCSITLHSRKEEIPSSDER